MLSPENSERSKRDSAAASRSDSNTFTNEQSNGMITRPIKSNQILATKTSSGNNVSPSKCNGSSKNISPCSSEHLMDTSARDEANCNSIVYVEASKDVVQKASARRSSLGSVDTMCRICHGGSSLSVELGELVCACACRGSVGLQHTRCLETWLTQSGKTCCELCGTSYPTRREHRYGVIRSLAVWAVAQNPKQFVMDGLGFLFMTPIAVLAAWMSSRTLTTLAAHDNLFKIWPIYMIFVLSCLTLVCYHCWLVSSVARHVADWWAWYRTQYLIRLRKEHLQIPLDSDHTTVKL